MSKSPDAFRSIGEVSSLVGVAPHVLRYWESQFTQLAPVKRGDGRRYYRPDDVRLVAGLCQVMREEGLSIRGARRLIAADRGAGLRQIGARRLGEVLAADPGAAISPAPDGAERLDASLAAAMATLAKPGTELAQRTARPKAAVAEPATEQLPFAWPAATAPNSETVSAEAAPEHAAPEAPEPDHGDWLTRLTRAAATLRQHAGPLPAPLIQALRASLSQPR